MSVSQQPNTNGRTKPANFRFAAGEGLRWKAFRLLETLSADPGVEHGVRDVDQQSASFIWLFVSTIGELNAIAPFIRKILETVPQQDLVFISDHDHYRDSYAEQYPEAAFFFSKGASRDAEKLAATFLPRLLVIAEIPCIPSDAPCRFSYAFVRAAKRHGAQTAIINGWLYGQQPSCRLDHWEKRLLLRDYLRAIDTACVQTKEVADRLIAAGLHNDKVVITGSMKFDVLASVVNWSPQHSPSPTILAALTQGDRIAIVVGCIKKAPEQSLVIKAFARILTEVPTALMVFALRHPEVQENLDSLSRELDFHGITHVFRTSTGDAAPGRKTACLILDTIGELKHFYAGAAVAHVGVDHNLLEPLSFNKAITTTSSWNEQFPNFSIFQSLQSLGLIYTADDPVSLSKRWTDCIKSPTCDKERIRRESALSDAAGASERTLRALDENSLLGSH